MVDVNDSPSLLSSLTEEFGSERFVYVKADIRSQKDVQNSFDTTIKKFKHLDIVINTVAIFNEQKWEEMIDVNLVSLRKKIIFVFFFSYFLLEKRTACD